MTSQAVNEVVIVAGARTPLAKAGGALASVGAVELGRVAVVEALARAELRPEAVDELIVGNIAQPADAANVGRVIGLRAGLPEHVPAVTVCRNCASGMQAITDAADAIMLGRAELAVACGVESMSNIPLLVRKSAQQIWTDLGSARGLGAKLWHASRFRPRHFMPVIALLLGLTDPVSGLIMGETAEVLAGEFGIDRAAQDAYALRSHQRATAAREALAEEIAPVHLPPDQRPLAEDVGPRAQQSLEALAKLRPFFSKSGSVTAGNSCMITDGAAALVLASERAARERGLPILGRLRGYAYAGLDPRRMGLGPVFATAEAFARCGWSLDEVDLVELNEAFAAQVIACQQAFASERFAAEELNIAAPLGTLDDAKLNVNGGAIALGHPVGATGARIALTALYELRRRGGRRALATLCVGGGQGGALLLERD